MAQPVARRAFDRVLVIMFENQYRGYVLANAYMRQLAKRGIQLGNSFGVMHPSQTNYIASIAGALCNVTNDEVPKLLTEKTLADLVHEAPGRLRWKAYMDSYVPEATPWTPTFTPRDAPPYYVKHNPFASFASVVRNEAMWRCIDNEAGFFADVLNGTLPEFSWFSPNIWNDGHWLDGTTEESVPRAPALVDQAARWLERFFNRLRFPGADSHLPPGTLVVVTFDEADFEADDLPEQASAYDGPNQIYTVLLGDRIRPGFEEEGFNHYSMLRTIEINFGLGHLGRNDAGANWFQFLWGRRFRWGPSRETPIHGGGGVCAAGLGAALFVAHVGADGVVRVRTYADGAWSAAEDVPVDGRGGVAMASTFEQVVLVACSAGGAVHATTWDPQHGWSAPSARLDGRRITGVAAASFDGERRIMLAMKDDAGGIEARTWRGGSWGPAAPVGAVRSEGAMTLGALGASLYLIVSVPGEKTLQVVSYNSAAFNVVTVAKNPYGGPQDDTTVDEWSPCAFPVAHFSSWPQRNESRAPTTRAYEAGGPLATATLDGVLHLVHPGAANSLLLTETFSIAGLMTPSQPVSYKSRSAANSSNGFGTLAEAGWSKQAALFGSRCGARGALALGRADGQIVLLSRAEAGSAVEIRVGRYVDDAQPERVYDGHRSKECQ